MTDRLFPCWSRARESDDGKERRMYRDEAIEEMKSYFGDDRFIEHTLRVLDTGERICAGEGVRDEFVKSVVTLGCIFHDIGIPEAVKKHDSMDAPYQEREGPAVGRRLMEKIRVRPDLRERVCYIIGHHHTRDRVDGTDFQIIWEADFIVNIDQENLRVDPERMDQAVRDNLKSATARALMREVLSSKGAT
jgi:hypothetical protein